MHTLLIVIGNGDLAEAMAPFDQDLEVEEYLVGVLSDFAKRQVLEYYNGKGGVPYKSFDECYAENGMHWNCNRYRKDEDGVWREYSTSNPQMKWDYYRVGGRFAGRLQLKEGAKMVAPIDFTWEWDAAERMKVLDSVPRRADIARLGDIANIDSLTACSVLKDGVWEDISDWEGAPVKPYLEGVPEDTLVTVVDYHM